MNNYTLEVARTAGAKELKNQKAAKAKRIVMGTDVHSRSYQAARKIDNGPIGAVAKFRSQEELLLYVEKQKEQAEEVVVVYQAGPLGYVLYRALKARGLRCYVCAPDSREQKRKRRKKLVPEWLLELLETWVDLLRKLDEKIRRAKVALAKRCSGLRPKGVGAPSLVQLQSEVLDWGRYRNRRKIGCLAGMVPSEWSTGDTQRRGSITKVGVGAIRRIITEMVWRIILFQPQYKAVQKWQEVLRGSNRGLKKKAVVAIGRQLMVDLWRLQTGRISAQELNLVMIGG